MFHYYCNMTLPAVEAIWAKSVTCERVIICKTRLVSPCLSAQVVANGHLFCQAKLMKFFIDDLPVGCPCNSPVREH
jgi:hypothetical protein